jgi:formylglycine-generating enzyme
VGLFPKGATPEGVLDLAGNVFEWTSSLYAADSYVLRGGSFGNFDWALRGAYRNRGVPAGRDNDLGFRLVRD